APCCDAAAFSKQHGEFVERRAEKLFKQQALRRGALLPLKITDQRPEVARAEFAQQVRDACLRLHGDHAETCPLSGKRVSFGLVRMANIDPLFDVARKLFEMG